MADIPSKSVRFVKLHLRDYGIFLGSNELNFDRHRTLIVGMGGTGKTTIVNALAHLGPVKGVKAHHDANHTEMTVEVTTKGNRNLVNEYSSSIFLCCEFPELPAFNQETPILSHQNLETVRAEARAIFHTLLSRKTGEREVHKDLNPGTMAAGERVCLGYAHAFAVRKVLNLDLPIVLDSPYSRLDSELRHGVRAFLKEQPYQQILLGHEFEFNEEDKPHYTLDYTKGYSRAIKTMCDDR
jgi:ABC-type glutathione transport system ATPase component